jgi:RNA polymerase sigma-70 factor (ECF subfamily)
MPEANAFLDLIRRVRAGDEEAAAELVRVYEPAIRRAARIRLVDSRLRRVFDSADISQSVFASFFVRAALGQFELEGPENLLRLLVDMSQKKLVDHARKQGAARRDFRRLRSVSQGGDLAAGGASPWQEVALKELIEEFRHRLSEEERCLADRRVQGVNWNQIAEEFHDSPEALRKKLTRAVDRIAQELGLDDFSDE